MFLSAAFDSFVNQVLADWGVPGAAIAIVQNDQVIFSRGYGVRTIGQEECVDARTVFGIGSATKAFTAAAAAALVDEGKLGWDTTAASVIPGFQLSDPWVTQNITLRDLLSHRSGIPHSVIARLRSGVDLDCHLSRFRYVPFEKPFRSQYLYANENFNWAGKAIEAASGQDWGTFITERFLKPLQMHSSSTNIRALAQEANLAAPHAIINGSLQAIERLDIGDDSAGSINANASDMAQWLRMQLNQGHLDGQRFLSPEAIREMHASQVAAPHPENTELAAFQMLNPPIRFWTYGFGWWVMDYAHRKLVWHGGQINGFSSMVAMLPEEKFGLVVLTNIHETFAHGVLMLSILDRFLERNTDWNARALQLVQVYGAYEAEQARQVKGMRVEASRPSLKLEGYTGRFANLAKGEVEVWVEADHLCLRYEKTTGALAHWHFDTFQVTWPNPLYGLNFATFHLDANGRVFQVQIKGLGIFSK